jgi:hypothetical protein
MIIAIYGFVQISNFFPVGAVSWKKFLSLSSGHDDVTKIILMIWAILGWNPKSHENRRDRPQVSRKIRGVVHFRSRNGSPTSMDSESSAKVVRSRVGSQVDPRRHFADRSYDLAYLYKMIIAIYRFVQISDFFRLDESVGRNS